MALYGKSNTYILTRQYRIVPNLRRCFFAKKVLGFDMKYKEDRAKSGDFQKIKPLLRFGTIRYDAEATTVCQLLATTKSGSV